MGRKKKRRRDRAAKGAAMAPVINDVELREIRYRGFFTYRGLRLIALVLMTYSQLGLILTPIHRVCVALEIPTLIGDGTASFLGVCANLSQASFAMLMISTIGIVLNHQMSFRKMLIEYFVLALFTYLVITLLVARTIQSAVYGLPSEITELNAVLKQLNFSDAVKGALVKFVTMVLPGDGTVHIDALNTFFANLGIKATVPDLDQLIAMMTDNPALKGVIRQIIAALASRDLTASVSSVADYIGQLIANLPPEFIDHLGELVTPWLNSAICGMLNTNLYWNLFLYTLFYFFVTWQPPKLSPGKRMLFHCCAVLPAFWMIVSYFVSIQLHTFSTTQRPIWFIVLLTNNKPSTLVLFFLLVVFEKYNELEYTQNPKFRQMSLQGYFGTKTASLSFSIATSVMIIFICIGDHLLGLIPGLDGLGFGEAGMMWLCIPFVMLYSFNKQPKHKIFNAAIPLYYVAHYVGIFFIAVTAFMYIIQMLSGTYAP